MLKINPKTLKSKCTIIEIAAFVFNEDTHALPTIINIPGINSGPNAHRYVENTDYESIKVTDKDVNRDTREDRMRQRQHQINILEIPTSIGELLYSSGIDGSV